MKKVVFIAIAVFSTLISTAQTKTNWQKQIDAILNASLSDIRGDLFSLKIIDGDTIRMYKSKLALEGFTTELEEFSTPDGIFYTLLGNVNPHPKNGEKYETLKKELIAYGKTVGLFSEDESQFADLKSDKWKKHTDLINESRIERVVCFLHNADDSIYIDFYLIL